MEVADGTPRGRRYGSVSCPAIDVGGVEAALRTGECVRIRAFTVGAAAILSVAVQAPASAAAAPAVPPAADFNNDGFPDLAIGAHTATMGGIKNAGAVTVAYGSATGLRYDTASILSQATPGVPGDAVVDGKWRQVSGFGDFDRDGYDDLVVRWLDKSMVLWGSGDGITGAGTTVPTGDGTISNPRLFGGFGVGDVNGDGVTDLVSSAHGAYNVDFRGLGVLLGPFDRTTGAPAARWYRDTRKSDNLGASGIHVGDMTGDGAADVVVHGQLGPADETGWMILRGTATGLEKLRAFTGPHQEDTNHASGFGDLNGDGYLDIAVGFKARSQVRVVYGGPNGIADTPGRRTYTQTTSGVPGVDEEYDQFGSAVAMGDTDRDGYDDLIIGAAYETGSDPVASYRSGAITVLRGSATGITTTGATSLTQNAKGVPSTSEPDDHFGNAVAVLDADRNGSPEVYVGANGEDGYKGRVWKLPTGSGVTGTGATSFHLGTVGGPASGGNFGYRFAG